MPRDRGDVSVYNPENEVLPEWLNRREGRLWYVDSAVVGKEGPWDVVADFGRGGEGLREPLRLGKLREGQRGRVRFEERLDKEDISIPFRSFTWLVNRFDLDDPNMEFLAIANFIVGTRPALRRAISHVGKDAVVAAPKRGGEVLELMLEAEGFSRSQMWDYQASRVPLSDGNYTIALRFNGSIPEGRNLLAVDDCLARVGTMRLTYDVWQERMGRPRKYALAVGVGVRRSVHYWVKLLEYERVDFRIHVGAESNAMDYHDYLQLTDEEKRVLKLPREFGPRVNDMGVVMDLKAPGRWRDIHNIRAIAGNDGLDEMVLKWTKVAVEDASWLSGAAEKLRSNCG